MSGHIIPDVLQKKLKTTSQKVFTNSKVIFIGEGVSQVAIEKQVGDPIPEDQLTPSQRLRGLGDSSRTEIE